MQKQKIIVVLGPTASGKSALAVKIAKKFNGEVISADSRQIYRGLNIGTGKVAGRWKRVKYQISDVRCVKNIFVYKNVFHHCIDFVNPKRAYTVTEYKKCAEGVINDIVSRKMVPIICGGTGLYIDAVLYNYALPKARINKALRNRLEKETARALFHKLKKLDPERARNIDRKNKRRLVRALEIIMETRKPIDALRLAPITRDKNSPYEFLKIGIKKNPTELKNRIEKRVNTWIKEGLEDETKKISGQLSQKRIQELGFNYSLPYFYFKNRMSKPELVQKLRQENWRYVKRQMTWFKRDKEINWIQSEKEAEQLISQFLNQKLR